MHKHDNACCQKNATMAAIGCQRLKSTCMIPAKFEVCKPTITYFYGIKCPDKSLCFTPNCAGAIDFSQNANHRAYLRKENFGLSPLLRKFFFVACICIYN